MSVTEIEGQYVCIAGVNMEIIYEKMSMFYSKKEATKR